LFCAFALTAQQNYSDFEKKLDGDQAILHALNRLTFGPHPGDIEAVKKIGLSQWIDLQLHPERIPENKELAKLLEPLVEPSAPAIQASAKKAAVAGVQGQQAVLQQILTPQQIRLLRTGTVQQGLDVLDSLPQEQARHVLAVMPAVRQRLEAARGVLHQGTTPGIVAPALPAQAAQQAQLLQLITQQQVQLLRSGSDKEALDFLATLPREKATQVLAIMPVVRMRLLPQLDPDLRMMVEAAAPEKGARVGQTLAQAKLYRAIESDRQLQEVLVDFWYNHFNVDAGKGADRYLVTAYERDAIRPHVLGNFRDLLEATANSPAMMFYLDNWQSTVPRPNARNAKAAERGLNENYARELMELHTLGVDGGYTQQDIVEVARCFTGWTIDQPRQGGPFQYNDRMHDKGKKTVLGVTIPAGGGKEDGEKVLDILVQQPSAARFISHELAQRFVADDPPPALVERMAKTFRDSDGDIRAVLTTLFTSPEFFSQGAYRAKVKTPFEMIVSAVRATGAHVDNAGALAKQVATLGEPLYRKLEPTGYSNAGEDWMNSAALLARMNFALKLARNQMQGVKLDPNKFSVEPAAAARQILFADAAPQTLDAIDKSTGDKDSEPGLIAGMLLGSPDFQRR
jgi:uncharacterized protein (DUF1800 family)